MQKGRLLVISGPSAGVGKDTIAKMFIDKHPDWHWPVSTTSRPPRPGEINGQHMNFLTRAEFEQRVHDGKFLEAFEINGNFYGTLREPVEKLLNDGQNVLLRKDVKGAVEIKRLLPDSVIIMLAPESWEILEKRMRGRNQDSEEVIKQRLDLAREEMGYKDKFDHVVVNPEGYPERALSKIEHQLGL